MRGAGLNPRRAAALLPDDAPPAAVARVEIHPDRLFAAAPGATRILLVSVSAGAGHVRAAEALAAHALAVDARLAVRHVDLMSLVPRWFSAVYRDLYLQLSSGLPEAWGWLYRKSDASAQAGSIERLRRWLQRRCARRLFALVAQERPHAIVCTHFLPAELLARERAAGRIDCPLWVQVTDFDLHRLWVQPGVSGYFVGSDELAFRLRAQGVPDAQIVVSGIPVMPGFAAAPERGPTLTALGLDPSLPTVLMMGGGAGTGLHEDSIAALLAQLPRLQLIVLAGRNRALLGRLQALAAAYPARLCSFGFIDNVHRVMGCADLAITKPGGLSTSECLALGVPMLLVNPIPGQEERNAAYLMQEGAALRADDTLTLQFRLQKLLGDTAQLARMRERALRLARPCAAQTVLRSVARSVFRMGA